jgi:hypothetical protein
MITRITAAVVAALLVGGSSGAFAAAMDHDPTTGLNTYYYYGPISELPKHLPLKEGASKYIPGTQDTAKKQATPAASQQQGAARRQKTPVYLLENRGPTSGGATVAPAGNSSDKASGHLW